MSRLTYGGEAERVNLDSEGGNVLLLEFAGKMALDKSGLESRLLAFLFSAALASIGIDSYALRIDRWSR